MAETNRDNVRRRYGSAYLGNAILLVSNLVALHLYAEHFGSEGFAVCAIARRNISILSMFILPALSVALTRLTAKHSESHSEKAIVLLGICQFSLLACLTPVVLACYLFPEEFTRLTFGNASNSDLALPIAINVLALSILGGACASLNGRLKIALSTTLSVTGLALIPLAVFSLAPTSPADYFWIVARILTLYSLFATLVTFGVLWTGWTGFSKWRQLFAEFSLFALPRFPQFIGINLLTTLPLLLVSLETDDPGVLSVISLSNYPLTLSGLLVAPIATILLPETSRLLQLGRIDEIKKRVQKRTLQVIGGLALLIPVASFAVKPTLVYFIDPKLADDSYLLIWFVVAMLPNCIYRILSSVLDALSPTAYNTINTYCSIIFLLLTYRVLSEFDGIVAVGGSFLAGSCMLGGLTLFRLRVLVGDLEN